MRKMFRSGDKLSVSGQSLQSKYYGLYTIVKKIRDLNYNVETPGGQKMNKLCHINV